MLRSTDGNRHHQRRGGGRIIDVDHGDATVDVTATSASSSSSSTKRRSINGRRGIFLPTVVFLVLTAATVVVRKRGGGGGTTTTTTTTMMTKDLSGGYYDKFEEKSATVLDLDDGDEDKDEDGRRPDDIVDPKEAFCARVKEALDLRSWDPVVYHKDREKNDDDYDPTSFDSNFFDTVEEDDADGRATVDEYNRLRIEDPVVTEWLLNVGLHEGRPHRVHRFLERLVATHHYHDDGGVVPPPPPLQIAVFGNSFACGSNCGESTAQSSEDCSWPERLRRRWEELFPSSSSSHKKKVEWHMFQENAQGALIVAQKLPYLIDFFRSTVKAPVDAFVFDTSMANDEMPWFEALLRVLMTEYPDALIVSMVDGLSTVVNPRFDGERKFAKWLADVQRTYDLAIVDLPAMIRALREEDDANANAASSDDPTTPPPDRFWPQAETMIPIDGDNDEDDGSSAGGRYYWRNFVPRVRKKCTAYYPDAHPPWVTHQHVADTMTQMLLRVADRGCKYSRPEVLAPHPLPTKTVSTTEELESCPICRSPLSRIDAKNPPRPPPVAAAEKTAVVRPLCGDWTWVTDDRNRSGWQSDEPGSLIRFRFRVGFDHPLVVVTYTASYETFGHLRIGFGIPRHDDDDDKPAPSEECFALSSAAAAADDEDDDDPAKTPTRRIPSVKLDASLPRYTLPKVYAFSEKESVQGGLDGYKVFDETVLASLRDRPLTDDERSKGGRIVDMYVENLERRSKIQMITAC